MKPEARKPIEQSAPEPTDKKPYSTPALAVHGDVTEITRRITNSQTANFDGSDTFI